MKIKIFAFSLTLVLIGCQMIFLQGAAAQRVAKKPASVEALIQKWADYEEDCRGGISNSPATYRACERRDKTVKQLHRAGYCHGKDGQSRTEFAWHKCTRNSVR